MTLGFGNYHDDGQFPDITQQLLEIKLQTSPTIDLGLVLPNSNEPLLLPEIGGVIIKHSDIRYAIFYANIDISRVIIRNVFVTTGEAFFQDFPNSKEKLLTGSCKFQLVISYSSD